VLYVLWINVTISFLRPGGLFGGLLY
jgi:hypothetical protein